MADQGDLHAAVVGSGIGGDVDEAAAGGGLVGGDDGESGLFDDEAVEGSTDGVGTDLEEGAEKTDGVGGGSTEETFQAGRGGEHDIGGEGGPGESEGEEAEELVVAGDLEFEDIDGPGDAVMEIGEGGGEGMEVEHPGVVVAGSEGKEGEGGVRGAFEEEAGDDVHGGAVAADGDDEVGVAGLGGQVLEVSGMGGVEPGAVQALGLELAGEVVDAQASPSAVGGRIQEVAPSGRHGGGRLEGRK
jgi:hypothetical protein